jgi:hypothetical protein
VSAQVYYNSPSEGAAVVPVTFTSLAGVVTDPASITCLVTDPTGASTTYNYLTGPNNTITRSSAGNYALNITGLTTAGLYVTTWVGTGNNVQQISPYTFRLVPLSDVGTGMQFWYTGKEELKSRLNITDSTSDYEMQLAIQAVTNWINSYCGRHFYQLTEARTYCPTNIWELPVDDIVSTPAVVSGCQVKVDYDGDGIFETSWAQGVNYQLKLGTPGNSQDNYNVNAAGVPRPYTQLQVLMGTPGSNGAGGGWLPFTWPYTHLDRVQVTATWGWNTVPPAVSQASLLLCTDLFKSKDAPWGVAGTAETGLMRVQSNPWSVELLHDYVQTRRKIGVLWPRRVRLPPRRLRRPRPRRSRRASSSPPRSGRRTALPTVLSPRPRTRTSPRSTVRPPSTRLPSTSASRGSRPPPPCSRRPRWRTRRPALPRSPRSPPARASSRRRTRTRTRHWLPGCRPAPSGIFR